jgi:hypothetical protein
MLCKPRAKAGARASTAPRLTTGERGAARASGHAIAADASEEHAGKPYRGAAILANVRGRRFLSPAPDPALERRSNDHSSGRTFVGPIPDRLPSGRDDKAALVRSVLLQRCAAVERRVEVSGES